MARIEMRGSIFDFVSMTAVLAGVVYGGLELHQLREAREREATLELVHLMETADYNRALTLVRTLPDSLGFDAVREHTGADFYMITQIVGTYESMGILVYRGDLDINSVNEFYGGGLRQTWQKLGPYVQDARTRLHRDRYAEWFQWLVERLDDNSQEKTRPPAYEAFKNWKAPVTRK